MQAWAIAISAGHYKQAPKPEEMLPLPYDEEDEEPDWDIQEFYNNAIKEYNGG